ncbi:hypothetical protein APR04_002029 [Promicromonospora umidemergens]|uniref:Uncharacterized protein n=1 Tax=Promicromonospora umidemergens TaxID=629679 RepID=A0ABP8XCH5_9MICO|nr:hypothetical protein [Promicromonospora umidemergens]MCP2283126.1 hypothetical protein [Promicromonospora umidemergens]
MTRRDRESGQALPEYVGVTGLVLLVVAIVLAAATPVAADVSEQLVCAVSPILKEEGVEYCGDGDGDGGSEEPGDERSPEDGYSPPSGDCDKDVTFTAAERPDLQWDKAVVQIGCVWYPQPPSCFNLPDGYWTSEDPVYLASEVQDFVDCVLDSRGGPKDDPNDESCLDALPASGEIDKDAPPTVQVGCREWPVPEGCEEKWSAYEDAAAGKDRAGRSQELADCITEKYASMEPPCLVEVTGHVDSKNIQFLFFRWGSNNGTLIEKLGDGRVRIHILKGVELGAGVSGTEVGGSPVSFDIAGITGYAEDYTYEFTDMQKAQDWVNWYKRYSDSVDLIHSPVARNCGPVPGQQSFCQPREHMPSVGDVLQLQEDEPDHHLVATSTSDTKKVKFQGGLKWGPSTGAVELKGSVEGGYEGEIQVEDRQWSDGSVTATYTSSDIGGFLIGAELGGKGPFTKDKKDDSSGKGKGKGQFGGEWTGTTSTSVVWNPDGELSRLTIAMDDQVMKTLYKAGIDLDLVLPYGFKIRGEYSKQEEEGTSSRTELIIDFNQYPDLRKTLGPKIDEIFPRNPDGTLKKGDVEIQGQDSEGGELYEAAEAHANVRTLKYDMDRVTESGGVGLKWEGLDLFKVEFTSVDENQVLSESSFEVTDVDGEKRTTSPAPQCKAIDFVAPDGYYTSDFSAPPNPVFSGGESFDNQ